MFQDYQDWPNWNIEPPVELIYAYILYGSEHGYVPLAAQAGNNDSSGLRLGTRRLETKQRGGLETSRGFWKGSRDLRDLARESRNSLESLRDFGHGGWHKLIKYNFFFFPWSSSNLLPPPLIRIPYSLPPGSTPEIPADTYKTCLQVVDCASTLSTPNYMIVFFVKITAQYTIDDVSHSGSHIRSEAYCYWRHQAYGNCPLMAISPYSTFVISSASILFYLGYSFSFYPWYLCYLRMYVLLMLYMPGRA